MTSTRSAPTTIPFVALREQYEQLKLEIDAAIASVLGRSAYIGGAEVDDFERWFAGYCGVRHALGVSSGTTALELVLRAPRRRSGRRGGHVGEHVHRDRGRGRRRPAPGRCSSTSTSAPAISIRRCSSARSRRGRRRSCPCTCTAVRRRCARFSTRAADIPVIEDAAQAHGARYRGRACRLAGDRRLLQLLSDEEPWRLRRRRAHHDQRRRAGGRLELLRDHGRVSQYEHDIVG